MLRRLTSVSAFQDKVRKIKQEPFVEDDKDNGNTSSGKAGEGDNNTGGNTGDNQANSGNASNQGDSGDAGNQVDPNHGLGGDQMVAELGRMNDAFRDWAQNAGLNTGTGDRPGGDIEERGDGARERDFSLLDNVGGLSDANDPLNNWSINGTTASYQDLARYYAAAAFFGVPALGLSPEGEVVEIRVSSPATSGVRNEFNLGDLSDSSTTSGLLKAVQGLVSNFVQSQTDTTIGATVGAGVGVGVGAVVGGIVGGLALGGPMGIAVGGEVGAEEGAVVGGAVGGFVGKLFVGKPSY